MPYLNCLACNTRLYSTEIKPIRSGIYAPIAARRWTRVRQFRVCLGGLSG